MWKQITISAIALILIYSGFKEYNRHRWEVRARYLQHIEDSADRKEELAILHGDPVEIVESHFVRRLTLQEHAELQELRSRIAKASVDY